MAYGELYVVGAALGGTEISAKGWSKSVGGDGVSHILFQILVGASDRQWFEVHYFDKSIKPLGNITKIIPETTDHPDALLDCCIAFYPRYFEQCPSLATIPKKVKTFRRLDFHLGMDEVPDEWAALREEARPLFKNLYIWQAKLVRV
jgi:hypothetical protein